MLFNKDLYNPIFIGTCLFGEDKNGIIKKCSRIKHVFIKTEFVYIKTMNTMYRLQFSDEPLHREFFIKQATIVAKKLRKAKKK